MNIKLPQIIQLQFPQLSVPQLKQIYQLFNLDIDTVCYLLSRINQEELLDKLIEELKQPKKAQIIFDSIYNSNVKIVRKYLKDKITFQELENSKQNLQQEMQPNDEEQEEQLIIIQDSKFLKLPKQTLMIIFDFMDPISLHRMRLICSDMNELFYDPYISGKFFKKFCHALFDIQYQWPLQSPFEKYVQFINHNHQIYPPELVDQVNQNVRSTIWGQLSIQNQDFEQIKLKYPDYKTFYDKHPRINFCGVYAIKETYTRYGEPGFNQAYAQQHIVEFYRYVRFWKDGSLTMFLSNKKQSKQGLLQYLSTKNPEQQGKQQDMFLRGEYLLIDDQIIMVTFRQSSTFYFTCKIKTHNTKGSHPYNIMIVDKQEMKMLGDNYVTNLIQDNKKRMYVYRHIEEFRNTLDGEGDWQHIVY